jgi:hypothetical protein
MESVSETVDMVGIASKTMLIFTAEVQMETE